MVAFLFLFTIFGLKFILSDRIILQFWFLFAQNVFFFQKIASLLIFLTELHSLWDHISPAMDPTWALAVKSLSPNHRTSREFS